MSRPLRLQYPGAVYHLTSRGNRQEAIFVDDNDRQGFLSLLGRTVKRYNWICHGYCLMDNHYHLLVETPDANLSQGMRQLNGMYTQHSNRIHQRVGHVFQGRYKSILVEKDAHLLELCRYIVLNPVRAKMCDHPEDWEWSSFLATATGRNIPEYLTVHWILAQFGRRKPMARKHYQEFVLDGCKHPTTPWEDLRAQVVYGSEAFLDSLKSELSGSNLSEVPLRQRQVGRPDLNVLFSQQAMGDRQSRNVAMLKAHREYGYTLKQIADHLRLHYSTISRIVSDG